MRRNIPITTTTIVPVPSSAGPAPKTWQDLFLQLLLGLLLQCSEHGSSSRLLVLALLGKHMHLLSSEGKGCFLLDSSRTNGGSVVTMWRQKLWHKCFPALGTAVQQASAVPGVEEPGEKGVRRPVAALLCFCGLAAETPLAVVQEHMPAIVSYSVQALMVNDPSSCDSSLPSSPDSDQDQLFSHVRRQLRHAAVQCLLSACQSTDPTIAEAMEPHLSTLVPLLLQVKCGVVINPQFVCHVCHSPGCPGGRLLNLGRHSGGECTMLALPGGWRFVQALAVPLSPPAQETCCQR